MSSSMTKRAGFTLIELTITVAIMGILAATAIGLFKAQGLRAKRTEAMTNVEGIGKMERAFFGENGTYLAATPAPALAPGVKQNWQAVGPFSFDALGFQAEGSVWFVYDVNSANGGCACPSGACFTATAYGDSDLDGTVAVISTFHADAGGVVCPALLTITPPIDPGSGVAVLDQVVDIYNFDKMFGTIPRADDY
jgi:prepilin-type N-terminal cleavage/methylation domain-containing protein